MRCEHEHDDGAYVLGALSPAERAAYERHLATCSFCREAVADMSVLPDLLSRLDAKEFAKLLDPSLTPGDQGRPPVHPGASLRDLATASRRRDKGKTFRVRAWSTLAAVVFVALIVVGVVSWAHDSGAPAASSPPGPAMTMTAVESTSPITAKVRLTGTTGGTRVDMVCSYSNAATRPNTFRLIAYGPDEEKEQIGSWLATPGVDFPMEAVTHFARGSLSRLELVRYDGKVMLAYDVP
nr:zf-HC2 domain-containing protein [uncultured Actinoplanes sp.]